MNISTKVAGFLQLLADATVLRVDDSPLLTDATFFAAEGNAENKVVFVSWINNEDQPCSVTLTEGGIEAGLFNPSTNLFELEDHEGDPVELFLGRVIPVDVVVEGWV